MRYVICLSTVMLSVAVGGVFAGTYSGGSGTAEDPYRISEPNDLVEMSQNSADWNKNFFLAADIDFAGRVFQDAPIAPDILPSSAGSHFRGTLFSGSFDGAGHVIHNLTIVVPEKSFVGLFGCIAYSGRVQRLGLENVNVVGSSAVGGLVGYLNGEVSECYVTGAATCVAGGMHLGGLAGYVSGGSASITDCYSKTVITGAESFAGGLVGKNQGSIRSCYSVGEVSCEGSDVGGLVGYLRYTGEVLNSFWDFESAQIALSGGGRALSTTWMMKPEIYALNGWDGAIWKIDGGNGYPRLAWENVVGEPIVFPTISMAGSGTVEDAYQIVSVEDYVAVSIGSYFCDKHLVLMNDLDLAGVECLAIGFNSPDYFTGTFDGGGHVIFNLNVHVPDGGYAGMFTILGSPAEVRNLGLQNVNISGNSYVGGVSGGVDGRVSHCYVTGAVVVNGSVLEGGAGGLVGQFTGEGISDCYSMATVSGVGRGIGGLIGANWSKYIERCYSAGQVFGTGTSVGGLVGRNEKYSVYNCFWDVEASGSTTSGIGLPLSSGWMKRMEPYSLNSWNGYGWKLDVGNDYPRLSWEGGTGDAIEAASTMEGSGTGEDPYLIATEEDFVLAGFGGVYLDESFLLTRDLDLAGMYVCPIGYRSYESLFDGGGHVIRNLRIHLPDSDNVGVFGRLQSFGWITDLGLENVDINGKNNCGGLVGLANGKIQRCYVSGRVAGGGSVGGLIGASTQLIYQCYADCDVSGIDGVGGLVGGNSGRLRQCYSLGSVVGEDYVGGLIGSNSGSSSSGDYECYAACEVTGTGESVGGLFGAGGGTKLDFFWDRDVSGQDESAGGVGRTTEQMMNMQTYSLNLWDTESWMIRDGEDYPHLAWENVSGEDLRVEVPLVGAGTEYEPYEINSLEDFLLFSTSQYLWDKNVVLRVDLDFDGLGIGPIGDTGYYGSLRGVFDGNGHVISNLTIHEPESYSVGLFALVSGQGLVKNLGLEDVSIQGRTDVGGLAGSSAGTIEDCYVTGSIEGQYDVGGLVGDNTGGTIKRCYARAEVAGYSEVGGLVGVNRSDYFGEPIGMVSQCYASCVVAGTSDYPGGSHIDKYVGGLIGDSYGILENCYSTSMVSASIDGYGYSFAGGLAGRANVVDKCYSCGPVIVDEGAMIIVGGLVGNGSRYVTNSFWDVDAAGVEFSGGGMGLTTDEMQQRMTYFSWGWDIEGETVNGVHDIWRICDGMDYPRLSWETVAGDFVGPVGVGMEDFGVFASAWLSMPGEIHWNVECNIDDADGGQVIDSYDLALFADNWQVYGCLRRDFDLVAYWTFDEGEGKIAHDSSIYQRNGMLRNINENPWGPDHIPGTLHLRGNIYVEVTGYKGVGNGQSRTVCAWIMTGNAGGSIVSWGSDETAGGAWSVCTTNEGFISVDVGDGSVIGSTNVCDVQWHYVAAVLEDDGTPDVSEVRLYVDGVEEVITFSEVMAVDTLKDSDVLIGAEGSDNFDGLIDEVRIYDRGLQPSEIRSLMVGGPKLVGHWQFEDKSGSTASDSWSNQLEGTLENMDDSAWVEGKVGGALEFDGVDDYVRIYGWKGTLGGASRTVCAWIKVDSADDVTRAIVSWGNDNTGGRWLFMLDNSGRGHPGSLRVAAQGGMIAGVRDLRDGQWHHVAAVLEDDGSANVSEVLLYIDGLAEEINVSVPVAINTGDASGGIAANDVRVGAFYLAGLEMYFEGLVDEVRIYDRALSTQEIGVLANP